MKSRSGFWRRERWGFISLLKTLLARSRGSLMRRGLGSSWLPGNGILVAQQCLSLDSHCSGRGGECRSRRRLRSSPELLNSLPQGSLAVVQARVQWLSRARSDQVTPSGSWPIWMALTGRGWGKTRTGAEDDAWFGAQYAGARIAIIAPTFHDARDTCVEGVSGLLAVLPEIWIATYNRSLGYLISWNQTRLKLYSATEPDAFDPQDCAHAWGDGHARFDLRQCV